MANYQLLKADIDEKVYENAQQKITGENLNSVLNAMVTTLGAEYQFAGVATTATNPGTPDAKVFYIANGKGTYTNFGGLEVTEDEVVVLYWDTAWHKEATGIASQAKLTELESEVKQLYDGAEIIKSTNLYNKDSDGCVINKYVSYLSGNINNATGSKVSDYIPVIAGNSYRANLEGQMAFYDADKVFISGYADFNTTRVAPANSAFMRVTISDYATYDMTAQVNAGNTLLPYEPYNVKIKNLNLITTPDTSIVNELVGKNLSNGIEKRLNPGYLSVTKATMTNGERLRSLYYPYYTRLGDKITMFAYVTSWGNGIKIGKYMANNYSSAWLEITDTNIVAKNYFASEQTFATIPHGLTIFTYVKVVIAMEAEKWIVILQTLGGTFKTDINLVEGVGVASVESLGASLTDVELTCTNSYFDKKIWAFGDSYYGMNSTVRQLYWIREWGYLDFLVDNKAGINSENAFIDLGKALAIGKPKILIWSLGMNDSTFAIWKDYADQVIELCEKNDITLILTTIPQPASTAVVEKDDISDWIRNSGIRYIDAAKAVGSDENGHWYGYGTEYNYQSDDNVHCSEYGAKAIATQFLIDVPEIMQTNP